MSSNKLILALMAGALVAGCVYVPLGKVPQLTAGALAAAGKASLVVEPRLSGGGFATKPEAFSTQAVVKPYLRSDVQHVLFALFKVEGASESAIVDPKGNPVTRDVPVDALDKPVTFANLHPNTTYRVRAYAFMAPGTASVDVISVEASSTLEVQVPGEDKAATASMPVVLRALPFEGVASSSVDFVPGTYLTELEAFK